MLKRLDGLGLVDYLPYRGVDADPGRGAGRARGDPPPPPDRGLPLRGAGDAERPRPRGGRGARALHLRGARGADRRQARRAQPRPARDPDPRPRPAAAGRERSPPREAAAAAEPQRGDRRGRPARRGGGRRAPPAARSTARRRGLPRIWPFLGPAFIAAVAYIDPGNFATNIAGGAKFGYLLLWVVLAANLIAMVVQTQSAKLGIATGKNLAELCRESFSRRTSIGLWIQAEIVAMATATSPRSSAPRSASTCSSASRCSRPALIAGAGAFAILAPPAEGLPAARGGDHGAGRGRRRLLRLRALRRPSGRRRGRPAPLRPRLRRDREHPARHRDHRRDRDAARRSTCTRR